jgi:hypothetical protein
VSYRIIEGTGHRITLESTLDTIQAANNRLRMLRKHNPGTVYTVVPAPVGTPDRELKNSLSVVHKPKFTVSPIPKVAVTAIR